MCELINELITELMNTCESSWKGKETLLSEPCPPPSLFCFVHHEKVLTQLSEVAVSGLTDLVDMDLLTTHRVFVCVLVLMGLYVIYCVIVCSHVIYVRV